MQKNRMLIKVIWIIFFFNTVVYAMQKSYPMKAFNLIQAIGAVPDVEDDMLLITQENKIIELVALLEHGWNPNKRMLFYLPLTLLMQKFLYLKRYVPTGEDYQEIPNIYNQLATNIQEVMKCLISYGADPAQRDITCSAYDYCDKKKQSTIMQEMEKERINYKNKMKCLRLMLAGNYHKERKAKNPDSPFAKVSLPIINKIGLYVLGRVK